jgi:xylulokinase
MVLGIDIGTTSLKTGLVNERGDLASYSQVPLIAGQADASRVSSQEWLSSLKYALGHLEKKLMKRLRAVVVCGNGPTLVPLDSDGNPLGLPIYWMKKSDNEELGRMRETIGGSVDPSFFLAKALSFMRENPRLYDRTRIFLPCPEYVGYVLTGNACAILPTPAYGFYYWNDDAIVRLGMDREKFPSFIETGSITGCITKKASRELGIPEGTPLVAGGPDFIMSLLGTGSVHAGDTCDRAGSSEGINHCSHTETRDPRFFSVPHIMPGLVNISAILSSSGTSLDWLLRVLSVDGNSYDAVEALIDAANPGAGGLFFFPHIIAERNALWGDRRTGAFIGLTASHGKGELIRSVAESSGFAVRKILDALADIGLTAASLRVSGSRAAFRSWSQLRADITGRPMRVPAIIHSELAGCACTAYKALGDYSSFFEAAAALVRIREDIEPRKAESGFYDDAYARYMKLDKLLDTESRS